MLSLEIIKQVAGDRAAWQPHLEDPYGAIALKDPQKPYFSVGPFEIPERVCVNDKGGVLAVKDVCIKLAGRGALFRSRCISNVCWDRNFEASGMTTSSPGYYDINFHCNSPDLLRPLHKEFARIARQVLGNELYVASDIIFTHDRSAVGPGRGQLETKWHVDNRPEDGAILMGILSDALPTQILLNPTTPDDYDDYYLKTASGVPLDEAELDIVTLPVGQLAVVPISMAHRGQVAQEAIPQRNFLRWWVLNPE